MHIDITCLLSIVGMIMLLASGLPFKEVQLGSGGLSSSQTTTSKMVADYAAS
jgi:hypothetical protein